MTKLKVSFEINIPSETMEVPGLIGGTEIYHPPSLLGQVLLSMKISPVFLELQHLIRLCLYPNRIG